MNKTFSDKFFEKYSKRETEEFFHEALRDLGSVSGYHGYLEERFNAYESNNYYLSTHNGSWLGTDDYISFKTLHYM